MTGEGGPTDGVTDVGQGDTGVGAMPPSTTHQEKCLPSIGNHDSPLRTEMQPRETQSPEPCRDAQARTPWTLLGGRDDMETHSAEPPR